MCQREKPEQKLVGQNFLSFSQKELTKLNKNKMTDSFRIKEKNYESFSTNDVTNHDIFMSLKNYAC